MPTLSLMARFPLGVYYGHKADGSVDLVPSPARLHAALLNAAGQGVHAQVDQGNLAPTEDSLAALRWMEENPPTGLFQPDTLRSSTAIGRFIYREVSSVNKKRRTEKRTVSDGIAVSEGIGYRWEDAPEDVVDTITKLAEDVSCLGESTSVVVLEPRDFTPNLLLDQESGPFTLGRHPRAVPRPGRTDALIAAHAAANPRKKPTVAADKVSTSEEPLPSVVAKDHLGVTRYRRPAEEEPTGDAPWSEVYLLSLDREVPDRLRVELCSTMHRTLISKIAESVSPLITGKYLDNEVPRPANRLAIQYLPPEIAALHGVDGPALALFIPREALAEDIRQIAVAQQDGTLWSRRLGRIRVRDTGVTVPGAEFWSAPAAGKVRFWKPLTPVIPETRPLRTPGGEWTLADSGLLSLGFVWRDESGATGRGQQKYLQLRDYAVAQQALVVGAHSVGGRSADYVHRTGDSLTTRPWTGLFHLGSLGSDRAVIMVGQSRHLGGGLLVPHDVPASVLDDGQLDDLNEGALR